MNILLYAVNPISGGEETELCFELSDGEHIEKKKLIITAEMFFELGFPHFPCGKVEISCGKLDEIEYLAEKTAAIKRGLYILSFADNTKKSLVRKLIMKGFSKEIAADAADHLEKTGYINETEAAKTLSHDMAQKKLYGPRRISAALYEKGFSRNAVESAMKELDEDFHIICGKRIEAMGGKEIFADKAKKQKAVASLMRYGFSYDDIREGLRLLK
ncbi:MAG: hypothetical protein E7608_00625 [Ruminococcaceae bacterium]|nr:hypothetical protein [Oscillospiraceae bacterium]